jgi:preprotein translocase subunit SecA
MIFPVPTEINPETLAGYEDLDALEQGLLEAGKAAYDGKLEELGELAALTERRVMLHVIDSHWQRHLTDLDVLREGIGLVSIAQRDPLVEYKRQAFAMFEEMQKSINEAVLQTMFRVQANVVQRQPDRRQMRAIRPGVGNGAATSKPEPVRKQQSLGRNDPCWCGSGKKYKHCHLKEDRARSRQKA